MDRADDLNLAGQDFGTRTLRELAAEDALFAIPIYQRPYVWGREQIGILLDDLWRAYREEVGLFYLGTALVLRDQVVSARYELIDGQQRFTTLWLFSLAAGRVHPGNALDAWRQPRRAGEPRISFEIREEVGEFFASLLVGGALPELPAEHAALATALAQIEEFLRAPERAGRLPGFCAFVMDKVHLVLTAVEAGTDLIRLFELINNRGEQLRPQDILKARLLDVIEATRPDDYLAYASLWDACAEMQQYLDVGLPLKAGVLAELFNQRVKGRRALARAPQVLTALKKATGEPRVERDSLTLAELVDEPLEDLPPLVEAAPQAARAPDDVRPTSILSFPLLLLHVLRLWLRRPGRSALFSPLPRIDEKQLLAMFDEFFLKRLAGPDRQAMGAAVADLLELLWEVRFCFDRQVVKNYRQEGDNGNLLAIRSWYVDDQSAVRRRAPTTEPSHLEMLQSVLYYSQPRATQYWLTPYLAFLLDAGETDEAACFDYLRRLDNHLFCSGGESGRSLSERTDALLAAPHCVPADVELDETELGAAQGTGTRHYWFYKLEFVLWFANRKAQRRADWEGYRIRGRNSVEHIYPQTPSADMEALAPEWLDSFGNLALTSRSFNSSQGNDSFAMKKQRFAEYRQHNGRVESLKMGLIFDDPENAEWGRGEDGRLAIEQHQKKMLVLLRDYCASP